MADYTFKSTFDPAKYEEEQQKYGQGLGEAQKRATENLDKGSVYSDERFKEITDYYKKPLLDAAGQRQQLISQYMRSRGLFDAGAHGQKLTENLQQTERDIAQNIDVPMMQEMLRNQETAEQNRINQAAALGAQGYAQYSGAKQAQSAQDLATWQAESTAATDAVNRALMQGNATGIYVDPQTGKSYETLAAEAQRVSLGLAERGQVLQESEFAQRRYEFDQTLNSQKDQFASQLGLSRDQLNEEIRRAQAGESLNNEQLRAQIEQFNKSLGQQESEFSRQYQLATAQQTWQQGMGERELDLRTREVDNQDRQFQRSLDVETERFASQLGLSRDQLQEQIDSRKAGNELTDKQLQAQIDQFTQDLQQRQSEFKTAQEQFQTVQSNDMAKFASQLGISKDQLAEEVRRNKAGEEYQNTALKQELDQFNSELKQREDQFNKTYGLQVEAQALTKDEFAQKKLEFSQQLGLSRDQLDEAINARKAGQDLDDRQLQAQIDQFNKTYTLQERGVKLSEDEYKTKKDQFDSELQQRKYEFLQQTGLTQQQLDEEIRRNKAGEEYQNTALKQALDTFNAELKQKEDQFQQDYGLRKQDLDDTQKRYDSDLTQRKTEFAQQIGLSNEQLAEEIRRNKMGEAYQNTALKQQLDTFNDELTQRENEFARTYMNDLARLGQEDRQLKMQELNAAYERAASRGAQTGEYVDPQTNLSYETLAKTVGRAEFMEKWREGMTDEELAGLSPRERRWLSEFGGGVVTPTGTGTTTPAQPAARPTQINLTSLNIPGSFITQHGWYNPTTQQVDMNAAKEYVKQIAWNTYGAIMADDQAEAIVNGQEGTVSY